VEPSADAGLDDAGPFSPCEGSDTACVEFDVGVEGCLPLGQFKAELELVVAPVGELPEAAEFPIANSFACAAPIAFNPGYAMQFGVPDADAGLDDGGPVYTNEEIRFAWVKPRALGDPHGYKLNVTIPADNWYDGAVLDLSEDPAAFAAWLLHAEYGTFGLDMENAWIEAVATAGTIAISNAGDPCSGVDCEPATGTMDIWFELRRAELDVSTVPPL
jgi:hypothetical protein